MAYALKAFRRNQISNVEGTPGTAEAAVEILQGTLSVKLGDKVLHKPEQDRNSLSANMADDFIVGRELEATWEAEINQRHIIWALSNAIRGNISPSQPDASNEPLSYLWVFEPGLTTANTPDITNGIDTHTWEFGDNVQAYESAYVFTRVLELSGGPNEACMLRQEITGDKVTETTFTGSLSAASVQYFPFNLSTFYIDDDYASIGGTQVTGMLRAFRWRLETMFTAMYSADGGYVYTGVTEARKKVELELTYWRDGTNSEGEKDKYDSRATTYLRIALSGANEMDAAQANPPYIYLDGAFRYMDWPEMDDEDGGTVETVTAESVYDATGAKEYGVSVLTNLAAYPA